MTTAVHLHTAEKKPRYELAHIFEQYGHLFKEQYNLPASHLKVMNHIMACRTAKLGGHIDQCDTCHFEQISYNSCRDRHCPKCQYLTTERWLSDRKADLLPVSYFHTVFTLPHELNSLILNNKKICFDLLFQSVNVTLQGFAKNPKWKLKGQLGWTGILHTWDQRLLDHFHIHCLVPAGALSFDKTKFNLTKENFLFPVKTLAKVFRAKYLTGLKQAYQDKKLIFPGKTKTLQSKHAFQRLIDQLFDKKKNWIVFSKKPFAGPESVLKYLGRYTHRIAISNQRISNIDNDKISFSYRDRADHNKKKIMTLEATEFIRRFLIHVLPKGFAKIRHFGFLSNRNKTANIAHCRKLLGQSKPQLVKTKKSYQEMMFELTGVDLTVCPRCKKGRMKLVRELDKNFTYNDSS